MNKETKSPRRGPSRYTATAGASMTIALVETYGLAWNRETKMGGPSRLATMSDRAGQGEDDRRSSASVPKELARARTPATKNLGGSGAARTWTRKSRLSRDRMQAAPASTRHLDTRVGPERRSSSERNRSSHRKTPYLPSWGPSMLRRGAGVADTSPPIPRVEGPQGEHLHGTQGACASPPHSTPRPVWTGAMGEPLEARLLTPWSSEQP